MGIRNFLKFHTKNNKNRKLVPDYTDEVNIRIFLTESGVKVPFDEIDEDIEFLMNASNLSLSEDKTYLEIPYDNVYEFYFDEQENPIKDYCLLNLPDLFNGFIHIKNEGNYIETDEVKYSFQFQDGMDHVIKRCNKNIVFVDGIPKLLPREMYYCLNYIVEYNKDKTRTKDISAQFELLALIKDYAELTNLALNKRLSIENKPIILDKIKLDFEKTPEGLEVKPIIDGKSENFNRSFLRNFDKYEDIKNFYVVKENDQDIKVIIKNKDSAKKVKRNRLLTGEKEKDFYRGYNELLEDDNFDLSLYGPRVKGLGYLNYRANASSTNASDESWFDFSQSYNPPALYTDEMVFSWRPEDKQILQEKLVQMEKDRHETTELELQNEGKIYKVFLNRQQLINEIGKINQAFLDIDQINNVKALEEIKEISMSNPQQKFIQHKGRFIKNYGQEAFESQIQRLKEKQKCKPKPKKETLLIKDNHDKVEHEENTVVKKKLSFQKPRSLKVELFEHQIEGVNKLQNLYYSSNVNGFLLADDMGLGKTIQILTFLAWLKEKGELAPTLVVAPTTLLNTWDNDNNNEKGEIQKFFDEGTFSTYKIQGVKKETEKEIQTINSRDIVLTTYDSLRLNHIWLGKVHWKCIICDEIQAVKNPRTLVSIALKAQNGDFKVACSATPIENTTEDLWNIMDFIVPGILGSLKDFKRNIVKPIEKLKSSQNEERKKINDCLVNKIGYNFLRRSKEDQLKELPNKRVVVNLIQANSYERERISDINKLRDQGEKSLPLIQKLVASCSHPQLTTVPSHYKYPTELLIKQSSKLTFLRNILDSICEKRQKAIIFTAFKQMQAILFRSIKHWYNIEPFFLNGNLLPDKRTKLLNQYRKSNGFNIIILSPLVAGVGITLTEANHVIHYTRLWNPAKEAQATDRVYRIGQKKDVYVYYPILSFEGTRTLNFGSEKEYIDYFISKETKGKTPEEKLNRLLAKKKNILNNFFLAAGDQSADVVSDWEEENQNPSQITINNIQKTLKHHEFEAACSVLFKKMGYKTYLTVSSGDFGVDVVIEKDGKYGLIQAKMVNDDLPRNALDEVIGAKNIYGNQLDISVTELIVISTAQRITESVKISARENNIKLILFGDLEQLFYEYPLFYGEVEVENSNRYSIEKLKREFKYARNDLFL